jgi:hypothetical protein
MRRFVPIERSPHPPAQHAIQKMTAWRQLGQATQSK